MELVLLRHGKATDFHPQGDSARELIEKGRLQARAAARILKTAGKLPEIVLTSPLTRARQTADEFCAVAGMPGSLVQGWLACGMTPETALRELAGFNEFRRVMIVGHEPDFSCLVESVIGASPATVVCKKGSIAGLRVDPPSSRGTLVFLVPPKLAGAYL